MSANLQFAEIICGPPTFVGQWLLTFYSYGNTSVAHMNGEVYSFRKEITVYRNYAGRLLPAEIMTSVFPKKS